MKRSGPLNLMLMASTAFAVAGCSEEPKVEGEYFRTVEQCISSGAFEEVACREAFVEARRMDTRTAPRYNSRKLCEDQHGISDCELRQDTSGSGAFFSPLVTGYFIGRALDGSAGGWNNRVRPIYPSTQPGSYTSGGQTLFFSNSTRRYSLSSKALTQPPAPAKVQTRTSVASRGGFGGRSRGSFGG